MIIFFICNFQEKEVSGPSGKANTTNSKNNASAKKSPQSEGLNPNNMFWAIKYKDDVSTPSFIDKIYRQTTTVITILKFA